MLRTAIATFVFVLTGSALAVGAADAPNVGLVEMLASAVGLLVLAAVADGIARPEPPRPRERR